MEHFLIYILKSAGFLSIFYVAYILLLKNDTSFEMNRKFLLGGIFGALVLPVVYFTKEVMIETAGIPYIATENSENLSSALEQGTDWWMLAGILYTMVLGMLLVRFIIQLYQVSSLIYSLPKQLSGKFIMARSSEETGPFSFFNYIVFNPDLHTDKELELILKHEMVHAGQNHTFDILVCNLVSCLLWFNPLSWGYKKSIVQNLEFIADRKTVEASASKKEYLHTLVKVSLGDLQPALSNSFYKSFIKKRILMLHKDKNSSGHLWKISLVFPAILAFMLIFNVQTKVYSQEKTSMITSVMEVFIDFDKNTTQEDLDGYKSLMAQYDVILTFNNIHYNNEGLLTNITVEFIDKSNVASGSVTKSNSAGIDGFRYVYNPEEGSTFTRPRAHAPVNPQGGNQHINKMVFKTSPSDSTKISFVTGDTREEPVYVVNGKVVKNTATVTAMNPSSISSINVLKGPSAVSLYGDDAVDGVVIITTKKHGDTVEVKNFTSSRKLTVWSDSTQVKRANGANRVHVFMDSMSQGKNFQLSDKNMIHGYTLVNGSYSKYDQPLVVVDGEEKPENFNITSIDQATIKKINIIKGEKAIKKYGEKAKGGVVEIDLKKKK